VIENEKKGENIEIKEFLHKSPCKRWYGIHSLLRRAADAKGSVDITVFDAYRYFAGQLLLMTSQSRSSTEYLLPTDNIMVLDCYFNLTEKYNFIGRL